MTERRKDRLGEEGLPHLLLAAQLSIPVGRRPVLLRRFGPLLGLANRLSAQMQLEPDVRPITVASQPPLDA